jgi:hypothetical protein
MVQAYGITSGILSAVLIFGRKYRSNVDLEGVSLDYSADFPKEKVVGMLEVLYSTLLEESERLRSTGRSLSIGLAEDAQDLEKMYQHGLQRKGISFLWRKESGIEAHRFLQAIRTYCRENDLGFQNSTTN